MQKHINHTVSYVLCEGSMHSVLKQAANEGILRCHNPEYIDEKSDE